MNKACNLGIAVLYFFITSCGGNGNNQYPQQRNNVTVAPLSNNVQIQADQSNTAFDVNALAAIVRKSTDPKVLEEQINDPTNNINNLDLDKDGKVDYVTVTEESENQLVVKDANVDPSVVVAKMTITPNQADKTASMQIEGTPDYCGPYHSYYQPHISFGEILFLSYLMSPHSYYHPFWGYRHYPTYYSERRTVVRTVYRPTNSQYSTGSRGGNLQSSPVNNRSSLSNPNSSQRKFEERNTTKPVGSGGFGNNRSQSAPARSTPSYHSSPSPRRSFGGRRR